MSRPKLDMPLKDHNSPRSQWISNVSLLKNQLKDGQLVESEAELGSKMSWNELEAKLSKRMKEPSAVSPYSNAKRNGTVPKSPNNLHLIRHPHHQSGHVSLSNQSVASSKRPTLKIPTGAKSRDILNQVHKGKTQVPILPVRQRSSSPIKIQKGSAEHGKISASQGIPPIDTKLSRNESVFDDMSVQRTESVAPAKTTTTESNQPISSVDILKPSKVSATPIEIVKPFDRTEDGPIFDKVIESIDEQVTRKRSSTATKQNSKNVETMKKADIPTATVPFLVDMSGAASVTTVQAIGSFALPNRKVHRDRKTKGSLSWLRRALKPNDAASKKIRPLASYEASINPVSVIDASTIGDTVETNPTVRQFKTTTPLQLGLWLTELRKAIRVALHEQEKMDSKPINVVDSTPSSPKNTEGMNERDEVDEDLYYRKNRDVGVYVDYSTFDDGDSVSSIELLFKWLTCRDLNETGNKRSASPMTPPGTVMATESNVSDDISIDLDVKPTRRTFFAR
jgi:hypothetical protein